MIETYEEYAERARETAQYPGRGEMEGLLYVVLGLVGEAGELANKLKKVLRDDGAVLSEDKRLQMVDEAGDVEWYMQMLADELKVSRGEIAKKNADKLADRKKRGVIGGSGDKR